jgi:DNA-binding LacI/PurR family transcriptional regulator
MINNVEEGIRARFIAGDHFEGGRMAARHLYENGHRQIAVIGGKDGAPDARLRLEGFRSFLKEKGMNFGKEAVFDADFREDQAFDLTEELLKLRPRTTAIFCLNDVQAHGVLRKLKELKIPCPGKISVMGYDDDRSSEHSEPPLTTVRVPVRRLAARAVGDLITALEKKSFKSFFSADYLPVELVERKSVARLA